MLETILIAFLVCKIKGYKINPIFKSWTIYPVLILEVVYLFSQISIFMENYSVIKYVSILKTIYLCSYLPMILVYNKYIQAIIGSAFVAFGGFLNDIAIKANNGFMPVFPKLSYLTGYGKIDAFDKVNDIHILGDSSTKLKFLTDIFDVGYSILSIGDIFMRVYVFIIIYSVIKEINTKDKINV